MDGSIIGGLEVWPLKRGETLSNHDWFAFYGHRFLGSEFLGAAVLEGRRADIGTALILWCEAMRQDPAGTLPESDIQLAGLARFSSLAEWRAVKEGVMHGWVPVQVEDEASGSMITRLGHGMLQGVVCDMFKRKQGRDAARESGALAVKKTRIRVKLEEIKAPGYLVRDTMAISRLAEHFAHSGLYITADNVRAAVVDVLGYTGDVALVHGGPRK